MVFIPEMYKTIKSDVELVVKKAKEHKTITACVLSAAAGAAVTRRIDVKAAKKFAYGVGHEVGVLSLQNAVLRDFVDSKGLKDEFLFEFIPSVGKSLDAVS